MSGLLSQIALGISPVLAAEESSLLTQHAIAAFVFSTIGLIVLALAIFLMSKLMPLPFWKEVEEDQNIALGILCGSIILGISIIIAAAIHG
jgi:putative membrane protein